MRPFWDHDIHAPGVHLKGIAPKGRNTIHHEKRGMSRLIQSRPQCLDIAARGTGRVDMNGQYGLDTVRVVGFQRFGHACGVEGR